MLLINFSIVVFSVLLTTTKCRAKIVSATSSSDEANSIVFEDLANVVASCYGDRIDGVGVAGDFPDSLLRKLSVQHSIPVALIDDTNNHRILVPVQLRRKLQIFIVRTESVDQLEIIIINMKNSVWWNPMASFFIIDRSSSCYYYPFFLLRAWFDDLLHAKVMCYLPKRSVIFSYNPFKSEAPYPWMETDVRSDIYKHPFTMFGRELGGTEEICVEQDFDKTKDMAGYPIVTQGDIHCGLDITFLRKNQKFAYEFVAVHHRTLQTALSALNATQQYLQYGEYNGFKLADIITDPYGMDSTWISRPTAYPHFTGGYVITSRFRGHMSQLEKILCVIDYDSRIGVAVVYLITLIFFKFFVRQALLPALLNLVRMTCNTGFARLPDNNASRMYLTGLLFVVVTIQGIYQGNLASLLTTVIPYRDPNTIQDLVTLDYKKIYIQDSLETMFDICQDYLVPRERCIMCNTLLRDCMSYVRKDSSAASIVLGDGGPLDIALHLKLHVSNTFISMGHRCFVIKWDWPLEERFNIILSTLVEADVLKPWDVKCNPVKLSVFEFDEDVMNNKVFKKIELHELTFSFVILAIGIVCSTVTFIIELAVHRFQSRTLNVRSMYPRGLRTFLPQRLVASWHRDVGASHGR